MRSSAEDAHELMSLLPEYLGAHEHHTNEAAGVPGITRTRHAYVHRAHLPPPWSQPIPPELAAMATRVLADGGVYWID